MNKPSIETSLHATRRQLNSGIAIDVHIFLAVASVLLTVVAEQVALHINPLLHFITLSFLMLTMFSCLFIAVHQLITFNHQIVATHNVCISAAIGSFLLGLLATLLASSNQDFSWLIDIGVSISTCAILVGFWLGLSQTFPDQRVAHSLKEGTAETEGQVSVIDQTGEEATEDNAQMELPRNPSLFQTQVLREPPPTSTLYPPEPDRNTRQFRTFPSPAREKQPLLSQWEDVYGRSRPAQLEIPKIVDVQSLPPLFEDDPLYAFPHSANARLFKQVKSNDLLVNSEDACAISSDETCFALCDGTSSSNLSRPWAALLAKQWIEYPLLHGINASTLDQWLKGPRRYWSEWVHSTWLPAINNRRQIIRRPEFSQKDTDKLVEQGASSTFLGITLDKDKNEWEAIAIGDSCLFVYHSNKQEVEKFPLHRSSQFTDMPPSITSRFNDAGRLLPHLQRGRGTYYRGDVLLMATDALAAWLLTQLEEEKNDWRILLSLTSEESFAQLVEQQRNNGQLTDDDTTLIVIPV